jgi:fatty-acyl-CoA synthase
MFNIATLFTAVAEAVPDRVALVAGGSHRTYAELLARSRQVANLLLDLGVRPPEGGLGQPWESGHDHVGVCLLNGAPCVELLLGSFAARAVPVNVNYRYVEEEIAHLIDDAGLRVLAYHETLAPIIAGAVARADTTPTLLQVADGSGHPAVEGAIDYESSVAAMPATPSDVEPSSEDLYLVYTGGTTGLPKGTIWTQADLYEASLRASGSAAVRSSRSVTEVAEAARRATPRIVLPLAPLIHGAAQWVALGSLLAGDTVVMQRDVARLDPVDVLDTIAAEHVQSMTLVGDAFARPICDELDRGGHDVSSLRLVVSGGAALSPGIKERLLARCPGLRIADVAGSSESGTHLQHVSSTDDRPADRPVFRPHETTCVLDEAMASLLEPGHDGVGWLARWGHIPRGYLGDEAKTEATFRTVAGRRVVVMGDRARLLADGMVELLGRDSVTINTGGEKVFAEEVEQALVAHAGVRDALVVGRPSDRWGQEVVALVELDDPDAADADILAVAGERLARYKLPKAIVRVSAIRRGPAGKADYAWARQVAATS